MVGSLKHTTNQDTNQQISLGKLDRETTHSTSNSREQSTPATPIHPIFGAVNIPSCRKIAPTRSLSGTGNTTPQQYKGKRVDYDDR